MFFKIRIRIISRSGQIRPSNRYPAVRPIVMDGSAPFSNTCKKEYRSELTQFPELTAPDVLLLSGVPGLSRRLQIGSERADNRVCGRGGEGPGAFAGGQLPRRRSCHKESNLRK